MHTALVRHLTGRSIQLEESLERAPKTSTREVFEGLAGTVDEGPEGFERAMIFRARDTYYVCKIYSGLDDEYEAYHLDYS